MDRYAIFVDAGYFFAAGAQAAFGSQISRKQVTLKSPPAMFADLCAKASAAAGGLPLLRVYWYDAMPGPRLSLAQSNLALLSGVKLRLGALNSAGEQKGVDSLIVTDIIDLARNRAIADAVIVTGDEDLRIAVQVAQSFGVRVHILAAGDPTKNVSPSLQMEADSVSALDAAWFGNHIDKIVATPKPTVNGATATSVADAAALPAAPSKASLETTARNIINELLDALKPEEINQLAQHFATQNTIPPEYDRRMIAKVSAGLAGVRLSGAETRSIRGWFVTEARNRAKS